MQNLIKLGQKLYICSWVRMPIATFKKLLKLISFVTSWAYLILIKLLLFGFALFSELLFQNISFVKLFLIFHMLMHFQSFSYTQYRPDEITPFGDETLRCLKGIKLCLVTRSVKLGSSPPFSSSSPLPTPAGHTIYPDW